MSFGASPSDITIVVALCKALYRKCRDASGEYDEISYEVKALHTVLRHLKYEIEAPESPLNRDHSLWNRQLAPLVKDCDTALHKLDELLQKYGRPGDSRERIRFGSNEMDALGALRVKLISHKSSLNRFLDGIQLHDNEEIPATVDDPSEQLDMILDKVDAIAARMTTGGGSVMSYANDDKEVWKDFKRELVREGFDNEVLMNHKDVLRAYIREIDQNGLLDQPTTSLSANASSSGVDTQKWLEDVQPQITGDSNASSKSTKTLQSEESVKEMVVREDNMKFPGSMKSELLKPVNRRVSSDRQLTPARARRPSWPVQRGSSPVPRLHIEDEKEVQYLNTSGSESDSESDTSSNGGLSASNGAIIRTSELVALSQALSVRPALLSSSFGSNISHDDHARRSIEYQLKDNLQLGSSLSQVKAIPIQIGNAAVAPGDGLGTSPRPDAFRLAPDSQGNPIPSNAKWTKINRRLVSPEVLDQDRRRYEARPEFVAVLGILSRHEIEDYAVRTKILRDARKRRSQPPAPQQDQKQQPPSFNRQSSRYTPDSGDSSSEAGDHKRGHRRKAHHSSAASVAGSDINPRSGYPNPFGAPPSPVLSTTSTDAWSEKQSDRIPRSSREHRYESRTHEPHTREKDHRDSHYSHTKREKDHSHRSHSASSKPSERRNSSQSKSRNDRDSHSGKSSRWRDNLIAGGVGGAAASLLGVLTEAAEGL